MIVHHLLIQLPNEVRRRQRITENASAHGPTQLSLERITSYLDTSTADEFEQDGDGYETEEGVENQALSLARPASGAQLRRELEYIDHVMVLGDQVREMQQGDEVSEAARADRVR